VTTTTVRICAVDDLASGEAKAFDADGHRIALVRIDDDFYALGDRCSHADYALSEGEVWADDRMIECPKHGSRFSLADGHPDSLPATRPVPVFDVVVDGGDVLLVVTDASGGGS
jgi:3-phenylpropionate/trans-cinnamate dioxygenase ferredoxin component